MEAKVEISDEALAAAIVIDGCVEVFMKEAAGFTRTGVSGPNNNLTRSLAEIVQFAINQYVANQKEKAS